MKILTPKENWSVVSISNNIVQEADRRRGLIKRGTYIQAIIIKAWGAGLKLEGEVPPEG